MLSRYRDRLGTARQPGCGVVRLVESRLSVDGDTRRHCEMRFRALLLVATGMTLVLIVGGIDLSVGSVLALSGSVIGVLLIDWKAAAGGGGLAGILSGLTIGALNGMISE